MSEITRRLSAYITETGTDHSGTTNLQPYAIISGKMYLIFWTVSS